MKMLRHQSRFRCAHCGVEVRHPKMFDERSGRPVCAACWDEKLNLLGALVEFYPEIFGVKYARLKGKRRATPGRKAA